MWEVKFNRNYDKDSKLVAIALLPNLWLNLEKTDEDGNGYCGISLAWLWFDITVSKYWGDHWKQK